MLIKQPRSKLGPPNFCGTNLDVQSSLKLRQTQCFLERVGCHQLFAGLMDLIIALAICFQLNSKLSKS